MQLVNFPAHVSKFLKFLRLNRCLSFNTVRAYRADLNKLLRFWQDKCPQEMLQGAVQKFILHILYQENLATKSLVRKFASLKTFARFIARKGINLTIYGKAPKLRVTLPEVLSVTEVEMLAQAIIDNPVGQRFPRRNRLIFELLYATGMRSFELVGIKLDDIDLEAKTIRVWGKGQQERIVLFGERAKQCLLDYLTLERDKIKGLRHSYLIINSLHGRLDTRNLRKLFESFSNMLPLGRKVSPHTLRHSFATHMLSQGVDLRVVQELLGHKRITATQIYTQISTQNMTDFFAKNHPVNQLKTTKVEPIKPSKEEQTTSS